MTYNFSNINGSGLLKLTTTVNNELMYQSYGTMIVITVLFICFSAFYHNTKSIKNSVSASLLVSFMIASMLRPINLISDLVFYVNLICLAISFFLLFILKD